MLKYINFYELDKKSKPGQFSSANAAFVELPNSNPLIIADMLENIIYSNQAFRNIFGSIGYEKISCLKTDPNLEYLLRTFAQSKYSGFECEVDILNEGINAQKNFFISVERVFVSSSEYLIIAFKPLEEKIKLESKLNTLNQALDYGNIPAMILDENGRVSFSTSFCDLLFNTRIDLIYNQFVYDVLANYLDEKSLLNLIESIEKKEVWSSIITCKAFEEESYFELKLIPVTSTDGKQNFILRGNDITEHIINTKLIKKNEKQLKSIINNVSDLLLLVKCKAGQFYFEDANENFCNIFSISKTLLHEKLEYVIDTSLLEAFYENIYEVSSENQVPVFKYDFNNRNYIVKISFIINTVDDETIYIVTLNDITDQNNYQEQLKRAYEKENHFNRLKSAILKNMSHEIRTPLNALMGYSEIIEEGLVVKDYNVLRDLTQSLKDILNRILNLFSNIVEVSHIESEQVELEVDIHNINKILKAVFNKKYVEAVNKNLNFKFESSDPDIFIIVDWVKMEKVIFALVDNAIKYTLSGSVTLNSEIVNDKAVISVIDTGIGMDKEKIRSFVEAFVQAEEGYTKYFEGAGLGLTMAYNYVEKMGGKIKFISELNKGTTVQLIFPLVSENIMGQIL